MSAKILLAGLQVLLALAIAGPVRADAPESDAVAIQRVMEQQQAAWNRGDVDGFMHGYKNAPDTTFVGSSVRKGYRAILDSYHKHYATKAQMGQLTFSNFDVRLLPGSNGEVRYAIVTGRFHLDRHERGEVAQDDGVFSLLWQKTPDGWKVILDHTSQVGAAISERPGSMQKRQ